MGNTTKKIVIQADVVAALQGMDKVVNQLQKGLQEGTTSTDLSKGMGNNLSKLMEKFRKEYSQFTNMTKDGGLDFSRASEGLKTGKSLIQTFEELQRIMGNISTKSVVDLKKMFPEAFDSRIDGLRDSMSSLLRDLDSLASKRVTKTSLENDVTQLTTRVEALKKELVDEATLQIKSDAATQTSQKVEELGKQLDDLRKKLGDELQLKISANTRDTKKLETEAAEIQKRMQSADKNFSADGKKYKGKTQKEWENSSESGQAKAGAKRAFENRAQDSKRAKEISSQLRQLEREKEDLVAANTRYKTGGDLTKVSQGMGQNAEEIAKVTQLQVDYADAVTKSKQAAEELDAVQKGNKSAQDAIARDTRAIEEKTEKINNLGSQIENLEKKTSAVNIGEKFKEIAPNFDFSPELLKSEEGLRALYAELAKIEQTQADELIKDLEGIGLNAEQAKKGVEVLRDGLDGAAEKVREISQAEKDMENLKNRMLQFFSLTNSIQLFRRAVTSAMNTVKELDATMTEAAVVTDFSIGDMWEKMPEYSAQAQKLGVAINDLYGATTLYYQQGLKTNEAMALGTETMKMAKIAGMDTADATTAMTSALRGFNMELNETSATRVNDVYSELAAVTAADANQIATAMEKTASIASSANMEFESTAAFLAQIIETTQEAPETAGTALKTIIARFSEVKSLREQGLSSGEDSEGEIIDVNKIQTALRSVGISMDAYFAGTEGLDEVLMRLAEKWGTLDFETQRYIATMAAGSRQQSRFIAMMSDYGRTQELVSAANNSAGASQKQYEKTLDSMETKLQQLKNAWDEFVTGLVNNDFLKWGVDFLTGILEGLNKFINLVSGGDGAVKSILSLITAITALKGAGSGIGGIFNFGKKFITADGLSKNGQASQKEKGQKDGQEYQQAYEQAKDANKEIVNTEEDKAKFEEKGRRDGEAYKKGYDSVASNNQQQQGGIKQEQQTRKTTATKNNIPKSGKKLDTGLYEGDIEPEDFDDFVNSPMGQAVLKDEKKARKQAGKENQKERKTREAKTKKSNKNKNKAKNKNKNKNENKSKGKNQDKGRKQATKDITEQSAALDDNSKKLEENASKTENAEKKAGGLGRKISELHSKYGATDEQLAKGQQTLNNLGSGFVVAGGACMAFSGILSAMGLDEAAEALSTVGIILTAVGGGFSLISSLAPIAGTMMSAAGAAGAAGGTAAAGGFAAAAAALWATVWPVLLLMAALIVIVGLIIAIVAAVKKANEEAYKNSLEGRMEAAAEATEKARAAAEAAKQAYDELLSDRSEYDELQDKLSGLTKGTKEWQEALLAANSQVLELIEKYPELAQYLTRGEHGQLIIPEDKLNELENEKAQGAKNAQAAVFTAEIKELQLQSEAAVKESGERMAAATHEINEKISGGEISLFDPKMLDKGPITREQAEDTFTEEYLKKLNYSGSQKEFVDAYMEYQTALFENQNIFKGYKLQQEGQAQAALLAQASDKTQMYEYSDALSGALAKGFAANAQSQIDAMASEMNVGTGKGGSGKARETERFKQLQKEYDISDGELTGNNEHDLEVLYAKMAGLNSIEDIDQDIRGNIDKLTQGIANMQITKQYGDQLNKAVSNMSNLDTSTQRRYAAMMSGDVSQLTKSDLVAIQHTDIDTMAKQLGFASAQEMATAMNYGSVEDMKTMFIGGAFTNFEKARNKVFSEYGEKFFGGEDVARQLLGEIEEKLGTEFTISELSGLGEVLKTIAFNGGDVEAMAKKIPELTAGLTGSQLDTALAAISAADWSTTEGIDALTTQLEGLGVEIEDELIEQLYELSNAATKVDLTKIQGQLEKLASAKEIAEEKLTSTKRIYSAEDKQALIDAGVISDSDAYQIGADEWVLLKDTNKILSSIKEDTASLLAQSVQQLRESVARGEDIGYAMEFDYIVGTGQTGSTAGRVISGTQLLQELVSGERDVLGMGTSNNIGNAELGTLAVRMGLDSGWDLLYDPENNKLAEGVLEEVIQAYNTYYIPLAGNREKLETSERTLQSQEKYELAGTEEFYERYEKDKNAREDARDFEDNVHRHRSYTARIQGSEGAALQENLKDFGATSQVVYGGGGQWFATISLSDLYNKIATDSDFVEKYSNDDHVKAATRQLAGAMGIDQTQEFSTLYKAIRERMALAKSEETDAEFALDLAMSAHGGSQIKLAQYTKELTGAEGFDETTEDGQLALKNLTVAVAKAEEQFTNLSQALIDNAEALGQAREGSWEYAAAIENIANTMAYITGQEFSADFIKEQLPLFKQLAKGGQEAADAYQQILWAQLASRGMGQETQIGGLLSSAITQAQAGQAVDLNDYLLAFTQGLDENSAEYQQAKENFISAFEMFFSVTEGVSGGVAGVKMDFSNLFATSGSTDEWENPYDKFYNTYEKINTLIRQRNKLEREYNRLLENRASSGAELLLNSQKEIAKLREQAEEQKKLVEGKRGQIDDLVTKNAGLASRYGIKINSDGTISMDWAKVEAQKGTEEGEKIEEFVSKLEEYRDQWWEAEDALEEIEDSVKEIQERGRDQYFDMEDRIKEALIAERQEEIDKLSAINDSINDANSKMLDAMQQQIDEYRQSRDNKKAEDEIADKQARLAYLQQNTSGANATEILKLEKEITEAQESHIDNLIDQKINELQQQNDKAAEQRERQIQIMEAQLQQYDESGAIWDDVYRLWEDGVTNEGKLIEGSPLEKLLKNTEAFESLSKLGQQEWMDDLTQSIIEGWAFVNGLSKANKGDTVNFRAANGQLVTGTANEKGDIVADGKVYGGVYQNTQGDWVQAPGGSVSTSEEYEAANRKKVSTIPEILRYGMRGKNIEILQEALGNIEEAKYTAGVTGYFGEKTLAAVKRFQKEMGVPQTGNVGELTKKAFAAKQYKTGGLADYTGPAWLDGTKSKPELVLNARDTQNFIQLKDVLASLMTSTPKSAEKSGDMSFDIDINVETINNETDLDMIANYIENKIVSSANYRNNTIVGGHR